MGRAVDLSMLDVESLWVETLDLSVALSVLEEVENKVAALHRPATLRPLDLLALLSGRANMRGRAKREGGGGKERERGRGVAGKKKNYQKGDETGAEKGST